MTRILAHTLGGNFVSFCEVNKKIKRFLMFFFYTAPYKKETKRRGKITRIVAYRVVQTLYCESSGVYVLQSKRADKRETPHGAQISWTHFLCVFFTCVVGKNPNTPYWSSMADDVITRGNTWSSGISSLL